MASPDRSQRRRPAAQKPAAMPSAAGVGCDICRMARVRELGERGWRRLLTEKELTYCLRFKAPHERVAGRFAAKEAVLKALGTGWARGLGWGQVEILPEPGTGAPRVALTGAARARLRRLGASRCLVSISHDGEYAMAFALLA